jgi:large subunit ribosomal protein L6
MSRLGITAIALPKGVDVSVAGGKITVKGPKGSLVWTLPEGFSIEIEGQKLMIVRDEKSESATKVFYGLTRAYVNNMVVGVSTGFEKRLTMIGVGYRAAVAGHNLELQVGFSHPIKLPIPKDVKVAVDKGTMIVISGYDKQPVTQFAADVRSMRPPEPYKGKGIRYEMEFVRKKAGKAAKGKTATA